MQLKDEYKKILEEFLSEIEKQKLAVFTDDGSVIVRAAVLHVEGYMTVSEALKWIFNKVEVNNAHRFISTIVTFFVVVKQLEDMKEREAKEKVIEWMRKMLL